MRVPTSRLQHSSVDQKQSVGEKGETEEEKKERERKSGGAKGRQSEVMRDVALVNSGGGWWQ